VSAYDLFVAGRPSVDVMFSGLEQWPELGNDFDAAALGVSAGTSFNTPAAANRIGLRVAYVAEIGNDVWSRMIHEEFEAERLSTAFLVAEDRPLPAVSVAFNMEGDRGFVSHWGDGPAVDDSAKAGEGDRGAPRARRLYRLREGQQFAGVCTGLAAYFGGDVNVVRLLFILGAVFSGGMLALVYVLLMFVMPIAETELEIR